MTELEGARALSCPILRWEFGFEWLLPADDGRRIMGIATTIKEGLQYTWRATLLQCPVCGTKPIFKPLAQVRHFHDWFTPLDGCPRCGYAYDREPGYFLMAVWGVNYGVVALVGLSAYVLAERFATLSVWQMILWVAVPMPIMQFLFARHAKAYFLALDHFFDPHVREEPEDDGGGGGDQPLPEPPEPDDAPADVKELAERV